jgi:hypothetical protein
MAVKNLFPWNTLTLVTLCVAAYFSYRTDAATLLAGTCNSTWALPTNVDGFGIATKSDGSNVECDRPLRDPNTSYIKVSSDGGVTSKWVTLASLGLGIALTPPPAPVLLPPPRCLPGDFNNNFHTTKTATGDTIAVLWCNDITGVGVNVIGGNLLNLTTAPAACLTAVEQFQWSVAWEVSAWNTCSAQVIPTAAQVAAANVFAAHWVPHVTSSGGNVVNANGAIVGTMAKGLVCGLKRMSGNAAMFSTPIGYTACIVQYPPTLGWP